MTAINMADNRVLLLNASYAPLQPISLRHAIDLMLRDVVDSVSGVAASLHTSQCVFEIPSVLRLRHYVNVPYRNAVWSRRAILKRDNYTCIYCGHKIGDKVEGITLGRSDFTVDHIIPRSRGGESTWGNTACACYHCNHRKANRTPHEASMAMLWEPKRPRTNYLICNGNIPEDWKVYLKV